MARNTKEEADLTRKRILDAAREVFLSKGVGNTSMDEIARKAGVTRGAIYWHFSHKKELFSAMREQVIIPLIDKIDIDLQPNKMSKPLDVLRDFLNGMIQTLVKSRETREVFEIMMIKCEYVGDLAEILEQTLHNFTNITQKMTALYSHAKNNDMLDTSLTAEELAIDTHLFLIGLLHMWVKDTTGTHFKKSAPQLIESHIKLRRKLLK
jgi:TetR/AcrR family transcriptional regulator, acrAB operon repressor